MITKINRIKSLGIFKDYKWSDDLIEFRRYNLIYGWNGSGKTTLSRLFSSLNDGQNSNYPSLEYEVDTDSGKYTHKTPYPVTVRVFNKEYVTANVEKLDGSSASPIFIIGDENKKVARQILEDEAEIATRRDAIKNASAAKKDLLIRRDTIFTDIARTISQNVSGESTRTYRRPDAQKDFMAVQLSDKLEDDAVLANKAILAQPSMPLVPELLLPEQFKDDAARYVTDATTLLLKTVTIIAIERLKNNNDIAQWVEEGLMIHKNHKSANCEFCGQSIPVKRIDDLSNYFNDADRDLKLEVEKSLSNFRNLYDSVQRLSFTDKAYLYEEIREEYELSVSEFEECRSEILGCIELVAKVVAEKKMKSTESVTLETSIDISSLFESASKVNKLIKKHNKRTSNYEAEISSSRSLLRKHYLADIIDVVNEIDEKIEAEVSKVEAETKGLRPGLNGISLEDTTKRITDNQAIISSSHKACKEINEKLEMFLGRKEVVFEVQDEGYVIKRDGVVATDLSEGERTAIAFVYFTVQLKDKDFDLKNGIVVIDDPISSLDSNSMFQAFGFLKESVKEAGQVFILTHNFDFLRQVRNWFYHIKKVARVEQRAFYMIKNKEVAGARISALAPLDKLLMDYESEYHYLFTLLHDFQTDGSLTSVYNFPNIGRKFLETYLAFKIPSRENIHEKLAHINFNEAKKISVLRFVETHSHADRTDGVLNFDMTIAKGGQTAIANLLELVSTTDETHYNALLETSGRIE